MIAGIIILVVLVILALAGFGMYNSLVTLRNQVDEGWSQIRVQLKFRTDLIPNLVNTVKGYAAHEKGLLEAVTKARSDVTNAAESENLSETAEASNALTDTVKSLFAVSENYPDLKASANFLKLQEELTATENKVMFARTYYNNTVRQFNTKVQTVPTNIIAKFGSFDLREYFSAPDSVETVPSVEF